MTGTTDVVLEELRERLVERGSALASDEALDAGLEHQSREILAEVTVALAGEVPAVPDVSFEYPDLAVLQAHGEFSAVRDVDPAEPLMAAEVLFAVALPRLAAEASVDGRSRGLEVARALHHAIWRRFPPGAIAYVEVLRARLQQAQNESRLRLARDLHDRIAHGIAAGLQRLDLATAQGPDASTAALEHAISILGDTLRDAQDLAVDLRALVDGRELVDAFEEYAYATGGSGELPIHVTQRGRPTPVPPLAAEELFAVVLEATRNARRHALGATAVRVDLEWSDVALAISVRDDGDGYRGARPGGLGLRGMEERGAAIGAVIDLVTEPGATGVRVRLPFTRPPTVPGGIAHD